MTATGLPPFIDAHVREVSAGPDRVWRALLATLSHGMPRPPGWLASAWGLAHPVQSGEWRDSVSEGDAVPGFIVAESDPGQRLVLRGRHRFSDYELRFVLDRTPNGDTRLRAESFASFPGLGGTLYRAMVIGTGGHRVAVRRLLRQVARRAESTEAGGAG